MLQQLSLVVRSKRQSAGQPAGDHWGAPRSTFCLQVPATPEQLRQGMSFVNSPYEHMLSNRGLTWFRCSGNLQSLQSIFNLQGFWSRERRLDFCFYCLSFLSTGFFQEWELALLTLNRFLELILAKIKSEANVCFVWSISCTLYVTIILKSQVVKEMHLEFTLSISFVVF